MTITEQEQQIILSAINASAMEPHDPQYPLTIEEKVIEKITLFNSLLNENSPAVKHLRSLNGQNGSEIKHISGVILGVFKEQSSSRGIVVFKTEPHERWNKRGIEVARTERMNDSRLALKMAHQLRNHIGYKVVATIEVRKAGDFKVRVIHNFTVVGRDDYYGQGIGFAEAKSLGRQEYQRITQEQLGR
ncbi:hypothetical protein ACTXJX_14950 [Glutamicibacter ardleyensis]|uniref:hypothetical protein n=1 Tax=Glutamicibacter ardleyensis TaxID=225894 RepID=UPI003FD36BC7